MNFLIILIVSAVFQYFTPWWTIALVPAIVNLLRPTSYGISFIQSFFAAAILWFGYGLYTHLSSHGLMSDRIAQVFSLPSGYLLLAISTLVGALTAGLSGMAGYSIRSLFQK